MMKNRAILISIGIVVVIALIFVVRFAKKAVPVSEGWQGQHSGAILSRDVAAQMQQADTLQAQGSLLEAKALYQQLLEKSLSAVEMETVQKALENLSMKILFSGIVIPGSITYTVQPGDVLVKLAKKFNTTVEAIQKANNIQGNVIHTGMKLRILNGAFTILVDKSQNTMLLKYNDEIIKTYGVSTGKNNSTPVGTFKIVTKLVDPVWYKNGKAIPPTSPDNILGTRWMGFDIPEYGIHGTTAPQDIGKQITEGCVRMKNEDVEELYSLIPVGTEVTVVD